jgi:hypothetical protein
MDPTENKGKRKAVRRVLAARLRAFIETLYENLNADQNNSAKGLLARAEEAVLRESGRHSDGSFGHRKHLF